MSCERAELRSRCFKTGLNRGIKEWINWSLDITRRTSALRRDSRDARHDTTTRLVWPHRRDLPIQAQLVAVVCGATVNKRQREEYFSNLTHNQCWPTNLRPSVCLFPSPPTLWPPLSIITLFELRTQRERTPKSWTVLYASLWMTKS